MSPHLFGAAHVPRHRDRRDETPTRPGPGRRAHRRSLARHREPGGRRRGHPHADRGGGAGTAGEGGRRPQPPARRRDRLRRPDRRCDAHRHQVAPDSGVGRLPARGLGGRGGRGAGGAVQRRRRGRAGGSTVRRGEGAVPGLLHHHRQRDRRRPHHRRPDLPRRRPRRRRDRAPPGVRQRRRARLLHDVAGGCRVGLGDRGRGRHVGGCGSTATRRSGGSPTATPRT